MEVVLPWLELHRIVGAFAVGCEGAIAVVGDETTHVLDGSVHWHPY